MSVITDKEIGDVVADIRYGRGISQDDMARRMRLEGFKWSNRTVWQVEKGTRPLRLREAAELAWILETDLDELLGGDAPERPSGDHLLDEALAAIEEYRRLNRVNSP